MRQNGMRVLIVEDEMLLAMELEGLVECEGHEIVGVACDARQAITLAEKETPDLALVDLHLRDGLTGPQIGRVLVHEKRVNVLFVTADPSIVRDKLDGALGVISKPYTEKAILDALRSVEAHMGGESG
jgi:two-component system, response regulator PdtaR